MGDSDDYIKLYWSAANTITLNITYQGNTISYPWDATGAISAGTTYDFAITYNSTGATLTVDNVEKIHIGTGDLSDNWWLSGGIDSANAIAVYQPKEQQTLHLSYT